MPRYQLLAVALVASLVTSLGAMLYGQATASPPAQVYDEISFASLSGLAFMPVNQNTLYNKNIESQLLTLNTPTRNFGGVPNLFVAPLDLPDRTVLTGLTVFGEDFDAEGAVQVQLLRCTHGQAGCTTLANASSGFDFAAGQFETPRVAIAGEAVNNDTHSYLLQLDLTAISESGLRAVRVEVVRPDVAAAAPPEEANRWELSGDTLSIVLSEGRWSRLEVCTDNLDYLPNSTHFPTLVVDGSELPLTSDSCVAVWGNTFELTRPRNTGPSSGTYRYLN